MRSFLVATVYVLLFGASSAFADYRDLYRDGKYTEALAELEKSPEAGPKNYGYYYNRGIIHHALNQDALAVGYLAKAQAINPNAKELDGPLNDATANLVKWLGASRLDATSSGMETLGDILPLDILFMVFGSLSLLAWIGFFASKKRRGLFIRLGFWNLLVGVAIGLWSAWCAQHPLVITTESRLVKSGPSETFLDRGAVEVGMRLRVVGAMNEVPVDPSVKPRRWWKVRFNDKHELGFIPESSGLLLTDESNTPES